MDNIAIGNRIKYARNMRDVTLEDIAQKVGVAKSTIQRYENGKIAKIKLPVIESIANALHVNPAWVIGKSEDIDIPQKEQPKILEYYDNLNDIGKREATKRVEELTYFPQYTNTAEVNAAHELPNSSLEDKIHDDDIMDDDSEWN